MIVSLLSKQFGLMLELTVKESSSWRHNDMLCFLVRNVWVYHPMI